jgi:glycerophosphoryl diester phosphodiesterase
LAPGQPNTPEISSLGKKTSDVTAILAHRGNLRGPAPLTENTLSAAAEALDMGFGLETDLRSNGDRRFYIAHDLQPWTPANSLDNFAKLFRQRQGCCIAINIKELCEATDLISLQLSGQFGSDSFYFDFELLEPNQRGYSQRLIRTLPLGDQVRLASRLSDRDEPLEGCLSIPANIVWADEFDSLWLTARHRDAVRDSNRLFYVISPELHGFGEAMMLKRWADFKEWKIDGLCTDYPIAAREFFFGIDAN